MIKATLVLSIPSSHLLQLMMSTLASLLISLELSFFTVHPVRCFFVKNAVSDLSKVKS